MSHPDQYPNQSVSVIGTLRQTFYENMSERTGFTLADNSSNIIDIVKPMGGTMQYGIGSTYFVVAKVVHFETVVSGTPIENGTGLIIYNMRKLY